MSIRPDAWIREMAEKHGMIEPFEPGQVRKRDILGYEGSDGKTRLRRADTYDHEKVVGKEKIISYGTSSYGYDLRVAEEFKVFTPTHCAVVDPKKVNEDCFDDVTERVQKQGFCLVPPNSFALCRSVERFKIPDNVLCVVLGKSSYARCGIVVNVTPLEPGWEGYVTIEISNTTPLPAKVYANEGIAQVLFFESDTRCDTTYADRKGKYQGQEARIYLPKL